MKASIEIVDSEDGGVTVTGGCDQMQPEDVPTGAIILWAYITRNCEKIMQDSAVWFAEKVKEQNNG